MVQNFVCSHSISDNVYTNHLRDSALFYLKKGFLRDLLSNLGMVALLNRYYVNCLLIGNITINMQFLKREHPEHFTDRHSEALDAFLKRYPDENHVEYHILHILRGLYILKWTDLSRIVRCRRILSELITTLTLNCQKTGKRIYQFAEFTDHVISMFVCVLIFDTIW